MALGNLETHCKEIIEPRDEDYESMMRRANGYGQQDNDNGLEGQELEEEEAEVDPNDPLYGLDQRLRNLDLDDESRRIIKEKLGEANNKIK